MDQKPNRIWRLRKLNHAVDAEIRSSGGAFIVEFFYDGASTYQRRLATRDEAFAEAAAKRAELERGGWMQHW